VREQTNSQKLETRILRKEAKGMSNRENRRKKKGGNRMSLNETKCVSSEKKTSMVNGEREKSLFFLDVPNVAWGDISQLWL